MIAGTYTLALTRVFVNAKMIHGVSGDLLSAVDFELPMKGDVESLVPARVLSGPDSMGPDWTYHRYTAQ